MITRVSVMLAAIAGCVVGGLQASGDYPGAGADTRQTQQTFRTSTDVVIVDVSVRDGGRVITGLGADDFVLTDNGVRQTIETVDATAVPIDLTLVVDVSGNDRRPWTPRIPREKIVHELNAEIAQVRTLLRETDRLRVLAIDSYVQQLLPGPGASAVRLIGRLEYNGLAAVHDTLAAALLQPVDPGRRHVVVARTKGIDNISASDAGVVREIAERPDALFHLVLMEQVIGTEEDLSGFQANPEGMGLAWPTYRFWVPYRRPLLHRSGDFFQRTPDGERLKAGIEAGGGFWHQARMFSEPSLTGTFKQAFQSFRQSYVLRYTPRGVVRSGWHTIDVKVPGATGATISARRGYGVEEPRPSAPRSVAPANPRTLAEFTRAYELGAYQSVTSALRQVTDPVRLMTEFEEAGNPWPATPRREAALAIEIAETGLFASRAAVRDQAQALLDRFARLVRHPLEPDTFERQWYYAVLTLLQGTARPAAIEGFAARALGRFPDEPRFILARAIAADVRSASATGPARVAPPTPGGAANLKAARDLYEAALTISDIGVEVRVRLAHLLYRHGLSEEALARLAEVQPAAVQDPRLRFLHQLFTGHALAGLSRDQEAAVAYRAALAILPSAQSARVSLMNVLYRRGERAAAEALAEQVQKETSPQIDPWWLYWQGQYRLYPEVMARLRELAAGK